MLRTRVCAAVLAAGLALGLGACTGDESEPDGETGADQSPTADDAGDRADGDVEDGEDSEDGEPETDEGGSSAGGHSDDLPGEVIEIFPWEGDELAVVVVDHDDVLNVRELPDPGATVVAELDPLTRPVVATGHNRSVDDWGIWAQVQAEGVTGWANVTFLGYLGRTADADEDFSDVDPADSVEDLALAVGARAAELNGAAEIDNARIAVSGISGPVNSPDVTVDVTGIPDDAQKGERLLMRAGTTASGTIQVEFVERTIICTRGVSEDGLCL
ncbi:hypothetical protein [Pseudactinotalea sp. Z1748]|uniref:hypothetical protein n=1 Tax=Pseudactinotalea sp. Z1748 TaxID=3413027 RepID=UPI003C7AF671